MGLLGYIVARGIKKAAGKAAVKAISNVAGNVVSAKSKAEIDLINAKTRKIEAENRRRALQNSNPNLQSSEGVVKILPPRPSEKYRHADALEVVREFLNAGFSNITLRPEKILSAKSNKYGQIRSITINGNGEFKAVRKILPTSKVVITYSDFKNGTEEWVYANVTRITPGKIQSVSDLAMMMNPSLKNIPQKSEQDKPEHTTPAESNDLLETEKNVNHNFCIYCGERILNEKARFCAVCGKEI